MGEALNISYKKNGSYCVYIENGYENLPEYINQSLEGAKVKALIITDDNVGPLYLEKVIETIKDNFLEVKSFTVPAGEKSKSLENASKCYTYLKDNDFHRSDVVIALGGGVVGDLSGFVASTYMRGMPFIQLPTSLLAMADSSIGGKCAVDLDSFKNIVGSLYMPTLVYENLATLNTLPKREFACGMSEILKAGLIKNAIFYEWLILNFDSVQENDFETMKKVLFEALSVKQKVVEADPFEKGERMLLNFGHTIGHSIEKSSQFDFNHGESIALGMIAASYISWKRQLLSMEEHYEIRDMFVPFDLPIATDKFDVEAVVRDIKLDKKIINGNLNFVLLKKIGKAVIVNDVTDSELKEAITSLIVELD